MIKLALFRKCNDFYNYEKILLFIFCENPRIIIVTNACYFRFLLVFISLLLLALFINLLLAAPYIIFKVYRENVLITSSLST